MIARRNPEPSTELPPPPPCGPAEAVWHALHRAAQTGISRDQLAQALKRVDDLDPRASAVAAWVVGELASPSHDDHNVPRRRPRPALRP